ncbi:MAG: 2-amino-4-hydroxy-6-hydroxymethyldihydropteridine diphosphokinase [Silvanigrellaceae bacterium]|nr:2-amino-4-hydroxy-6-hydroxymethyldihydropteridine diphosphokinase [Silvanigrellaceae bacterium]
MAFGSNLGDRVWNLQQGLTYLSCYVKFRAFSQWKLTQPLQDFCYFTENHECYLNFACEISTYLTPEQLYTEIYTIENKVGHSRLRKWLPRHLDIDIVFAALNNHKNFSLCTPLRFENKKGLKIPHQGYFQRDFWRFFIEKELYVQEQAIISHFVSIV